VRIPGSFRKTDLARLGLLAVVFCQPGFPQEPAVSRLAGVVLDGATETPLRDVRVEVATGGQFLRTTTDAEGRFLVEDVPPGSHVLRAARAGYMGARLNGRTLPGNDGIPLTFVAGQDIEGVLRMYPAAIARGRVLDARGRPAQGMTVVPFRQAYDASGVLLRRDFPEALTNDLGEFRFNDLDPGAYFFRIEPPPLGLAETSPAVYAPVYYPRSVEAARAEPVVLPGGEETRLPDFTLRAEAGGMVRVRVVLPPGIERPPSAAVNVRRTGERAATRTGVLTVGLEGEIGPLPLGSWEIDVLHRQGRGSASVDVAGTDVDVEIRIVPNADVRGRALVEGDSPRPVSGVRVALTDPLSPLPLAREASTSEDGTFTLGGIGAGTHRIRVVGVPPGLYVREVVSGERDVLRDGLVAEGRPVDLGVALGEDAGRVAGTVVDSEDRPVPAAVVVLAPADADLRHRSRSVTALADGTFAFVNVVPGDYAMYAWLELDGAAYLDEAFMRAWEGSGLTVRVGPAEERAGRIPVLER
jgi:hypothetical protein